MYVVSLKSVITNAWSTQTGNIAVIGLEENTIASNDLFKFWIMQQSFESLQQSGSENQS